MRPFIPDEISEYIHLSQSYPARRIKSHILKDYSEYGSSQFSPLPQGGGNMLQKTSYSPHKNSSNTFHPPAPSHGSGNSRPGTT